MSTPVHVDLDPARHAIMLGGIRVICCDYLPPNTMVVPPALWRQFAGLEPEPHPAAALLKAVLGDGR